MRIAQVSTVSAPVRRETHGSVESLVWLLSRELVRLGHEVTVFGTAGSETEGELVATLPGPYGANGAPGDWQLCEWINLCRAVEQSGRFDVIHAHAYLWGLPLQPMSRAPMVHTIHIVPDDTAAFLWSRQSDAYVTAISNHQWSAYPALQPRAVVPHGVEVDQFAFCAEPEDYVCYLGRFVSGKGPVQAIKMAKRMGIRLKLAGAENSYFREKVAPLVDGDAVQYVGFLKGVERSRFIGQARAMLYPIQYPEAFGLVLLESMLCGTPVAAMRLGAVPEIIEEGVTGYTSENLEDFPELVRQACALDRHRVHQRAAKNFSAERMARDYARVYKGVANSRIS